MLTALPENSNVSPPSPDEDGAGRDRAALGKIIRQVMVAAAAFVLTAAVWEVVTNSLHARPEIPEPFKTKIDLCLGTKNTPYDTAFIGSSRYFHGIDPASFDAETARRGMPTHSYNLGFDALSFYELRFVVEHVLADPRSHLKYLFIEPSLRVRLAPGLEHSQRAIVLHDATGTQKIFDLVLHGNHDLKRKLFWMYEQASVTAVRLTNVGALTNRFIRPQEPPTDLVEVAGSLGNGYSGLDPHIPLGPKTTAEDLKQMMVEQKTLEKAGAARQLNSFEVAQLNQLQALAASHGVTLLLLAPPTAAGDMYGEFSAVTHAPGLSSPVFNFADPVAYFDLYDPAGFVDPDHISAPVAQKWSLHAADAFADWVAGQKDSPRRHGEHGEEKIENRGLKMEDRQPHAVAPVGEAGSSILNFRSSIFYTPSSIFSPLSSPCSPCLRGESFSDFADPALRRSSDTGLGGDR